MSRSIKKSGIIKDKGFLKNLYNKKFRRVNKLRIRLGKEPFLMREVVNDYDVCDYVFSWTESLEPPQEMGDEILREWLKERRAYFGK